MSRRHRLRIRSSVVRTPCSWSIRNYTRDYSLNIRNHVTVSTNEIVTDIHDTGSGAESREQSNAYNSNIQRAMATASQRAQLTAVQRGDRRNSTLPLYRHSRKEEELTPPADEAGQEVMTRSVAGMGSLYLQFPAAHLISFASY
uniref:Uncharacterized protein n=1 Tax=Timema monikensis TaxID=170555 RepID=A0A7R9DY21_9NEOP|nr:unnamed protein product [Timema monikensis]